MKGVFRLLGQFFSFGRGATTFVILVALSLWMLKQPPQTKQSLAESTASYVFFPAQSAIHWFTYYRSLSSENEALKSKLAEYSVQNKLLIQQLLEQKRLDTLVAYKADTLPKAIIAKVVARDPALLDLSLVIDRGTRDSVFVNMPVFTPKGLIGRISKAYQNHSLVQLLKDPSSRVALMHTQTRMLGVLQSNDSRRIFFNFPRQAVIKKGDTLMTSGFGGVYPQGIPVGTVDGFYKSDLQVMRLAEVRLFQDPAFLEEVFVLKSTNSWIIPEPLAPIDTSKAGSARYPLDSVLQSKSDSSANN